MAIDKKKLSGSDLYDYYLTDCKDKEYASIVSLLPLACGSEEEAHRILDYCNKNDKSLIVFNNPSIPIPNENLMTYVGSVNDGVLYIK